jgi:hypothetical protein
MPVRSLSLAVVTLGLFAFGAVAQEAKKEDAAKAAVASKAVTSQQGAKPTTYMFVQTAKKGTFHSEPAEGSKVQEYELRLEGVEAETIYFSDRPARIAGTVANQKFLDGIGFEPSNPPNAAVVLSNPVSKSQDVIIAQLLNPRYDADAATLTYDVIVMKNYKGRGLQHWVEMADPSLPESFSTVSLFIDDCPDGQVMCYGIFQRSGRTNCRVGCGSVGKTVGYCWSWYSFSCNPCRDYTYLCSEPGGPCDNRLPFCPRNQCGTSRVCM